MFVVIFRARIRLLDEEYSRTASMLRDLALQEFGCLAFHAVAEGDEEIALSYWSSLEQIRAWKAHPKHIEAQRLGKERWYDAYSVEVTEVTRRYSWEG
ncbi:MAG: antibiotic biosynthesis monooxygenase [Myxococcales bacterium]|nr:antibiotic biosynthesis monooxygenase [Myxococcales bacterium]